MIYDKHIILTGFMASGKSTIGQLLSVKLHKDFIDLDNYIEKKAKKSISNIFSEDGEGSFRKLESESLREILSSKQAKIIATGGGIIENPLHLDLLKKELTFFLDVSFENIQKRLNSEEREKRPLAKDIKIFKELYLHRLPLYQQVGITIKADQSMIEVTESVLKKISEHYPVIELKTEQKSSLIESGFNFLPSRIAQLTAGKKKVFLLDHAFKEEADFWLKELNSPVYFTDFIGEDAKSINQAEKFLEFLAAQGLARDDWVIVKGGGSLTDLGAFCAGLYKRGLNLILAPTTLLAAVDAAIGGKTAVNMSGAKNQVGHFYLAAYVLIDQEILANLPQNLLSEGLAEAYKTGLLKDPQLAFLIEDQIENLFNGDMSLLPEICYHSYKAKAEVVALDFREEKGLRDILNLGHTYGHVLESYYSPKLSHGQAVAAGLAVAANYSITLGLPAEKAKKIVKTAKIIAGSWPKPVPKDEAIKLLHFDKKIRNNTLKFIALENIGKPILISITAEELIKQAMETLNV